MRDIVCRQFISGAALASHEPEPERQLNDGT